MKEILKRIYIILVSPDESSNIGSVCRAMKTMGIKNLRIAGPKTYDENKIKYISVHAFDIYQNRQEFQSLNDALYDVSFAVAATRRKGKKRKYSSFTPEEMTDLISRNNYEKIAVVFGNEEHGLTACELSECSISVSIPSSPEFPSLNLSHAVQIITHALYCGLSGNPVNSADNKIDIRDADDLASGITDYLRNIGFFKIADDSDMRIFLRDIFSRAALNIAEKDKLLKLFRKIAGMIPGSGRNDSENTDQPLY